MLYAEWQLIARQNRVDRNEDRTPGANLFHLGGSLNIPVGRTNEIEITLTARNIFNTRYYNHLSLQESRNSGTGTKLPIINQNSI
jgi:iron complex outermembrane receptor protein